MSWHRSSAGKLRRGRCTDRRKRSLIYNRGSTRRSRTHVKHLSEGDAAELTRKIVIKWMEGKQRKNGGHWVASKGETEAGKVKFKDTTRRSLGCTEAVRADVTLTTCFAPAQPIAFRSLVLFRPHPDHTGCVPHCACICICVPSEIGVEGTNGRKGNPCWRCNSTPRDHLTTDRRVPTASVNSPLLRG